jgi:hypothetical protein
MKLTVIDVTSKLFVLWTENFMILMMVVVVRLQIIVRLSSCLKNWFRYTEREKKSIKLENAIRNTVDEILDGIEQPQKFHLLERTTAAGNRRFQSSCVHKCVFACYIITKTMENCS